MLGRRLATMGGLGAAATAVTVLVSTPAWAVPVLLPSVNLGGSGPYHVTGACNPGPGVATNLNQITYVIDASASSFATNGARPIGTGVTCVVRNSVTHAVYGTVSGALPGAEAVAAGLVAVPTNVSAELCVSENALFSDNGTANNSNC